MDREQTERVLSIRQKVAIESLTFDGSIERAAELVAVMPNRVKAWKRNPTFARALMERKRAPGRPKEYVMEMFAETVARRAGQAEEPWRAQEGRDHV
jgi:hypothetical protein